MVPPIATVKISPLPNPYPLLVISKSITLEPCPTTISTFASVPKPETEDDEYSSERLEYERGASNTT